MKCPTCKGYCKIPNPDPSGDPRIWVRCPLCHGKGEVDELPPDPPLPPDWDKQ